MTILIGVPTYDDRVMSGLAMALMGEQHQPRCVPYSVAFKQASLLAFAHNELLCIALNNRPDITHLLLIHADVLPVPGFIGQMWDDMVRANADVLSALLPIKDTKGLTSTALLPSLAEARRPGRREYKRRRLTMQESEQLPEVFTVTDLQKLFSEPSEDAALLVNTGLMLIDVRKPWIEQAHFEINDAIYRNEAGLFYPDVEPEDWHFSRQIADLGVRVAVTRRVQARHVGRMNYPNQTPWGEWAHDQSVVSPEQIEEHHEDSVPEQIREPSPALTA